MIAPERLHRRHVDHDESARFGHPEHFGDGGVFDGFLERIQHVEGSDDIEGIGRKRDRSHRRAREPRPSCLAADFQADCCQIESVSAPELSKKYQVIPGTAPAIEDKWIDSAFGRLTEKWKDEQTETTKPEMSRLGTRGGAQQMLHCRNSSVSRIDT